MHIAFNRNQINPKKEDKKAGKSGRKIRKQTFFLNLVTEILFSYITLTQVFTLYFMDMQKERILILLNYTYLLITLLHNWIVSAKTNIVKTEIDTVSDLELIYSFKIFPLIKKLIKMKWCVCVFACVCMCEWVCHCTYVEVRGKLLAVNTFLLLCMLQKLNSADWP